ncbi:MAG: NAD-dependent epimerase/dehydratase family protein, partial [Chlamydiia bacterium]|nr:NAD-dependent epimerase/dehydratase family protein [Chlamydiia bacterium]
TWFCKALSALGHEVTALYSKSEYEGLRKKRVEALKGKVEAVFDAPLGSARFFETVENAPRWDFFCHHASFVEGYKSPDFDAVLALQNNIAGLSEALEILRGKGVKALVYTGSVFEKGEGAGSMPLHAFSPYGVSKSLTSDWLEHACLQRGIAYKKFVIANPFGPLEEPRFTHYLLDKWKEGEVPEVRTPDYVRDNIPVTALADSYAAFLTAPECKRTPSAYAGSQHAFTSLMSEEVAKRVGRACPFHAVRQTDFSEPLIRVGVDRLNFAEKPFWNTYLEAF